ADIIVNFTAAAMKPHGGETPGSIRPRRHAHYGLKHIPFRLAKVTGLLMPGKLQPVTRWIGSLEGNQRTGPPNAAKRTIENIFALSYAQRETWSYCSSTSLPALYSKRRSRDRNDRPRRLSLSASSGITSAATSRTTRSPTSTLSSLAGAARTVPFAVLTSVTNSRCAG